MNWLLLIAPPPPPSYRMCGPTIVQEGEPRRGVSLGLIRIRFCEGLLMSRPLSAPAKRWG